MRYTFLALILLWCAPIFAQRFGGTPPAVKWRSVENERVRVIHPPGMEEDAERIAAIASSIGVGTDPTIGGDQKKISIVLHDHTMVANAYVQLAPWRSEFFMTPMQNSLDLGSLAWTDQLALHEFRHVQQYSNFRKGLSRFFYYLAGQEGQALANAGAIPDWFFEGDAVFQETMASHQGRGRLPYFFNEFRAIWESGSTFSYMKLRNGSLRDQIPDHYQLGYPLVAYGRQKFGPDIWKKVTDRAVRYQPLFYPFQGAFKKISGQVYSQFVQEALAYFSSSYSDAAKEFRPSPITPPEKRTVDQYFMPQYVGKDSIIALKRGFRQIPAFVLLSRGRETRIAVKDISVDDHFSYQAGKLVYSGYRSNSRWSWVEYNDVVVYDMNSSERKWITSGQRYFSPSFSPDGQQIVVVEAGPSRHSQLIILDAGSGERISVLPNPDSLFYTYPIFSADGRSIISAVRNADGLMALMSSPVSGSAPELLIPFTHQAIATPRVAGEGIWFTSNRSGRDEVFLYHRSSKQISRVVSHYTGSYDPTGMTTGDSVTYASVSMGGRLLYSEKVSEVPLGGPEAFSLKEDDLYVGNTLQQGLSRLLDTLKISKLENKRYREGIRIFNFHSWRPMYEQPDWSFNIYGNNVLNTLNSSLYYNYNENESSHRLGFDETFGAWFPWITGGGSYTFNRSANLDTGSITHWDELNAHAGIRIPLNFTKGLFSRDLVISTTYQVQQARNQIPASERFVIPSATYLESSVRWAMRGQQAIRQIFPRFANSFYLQHRYRFGDSHSWQLLATGSLYLPGLFRDHSLVINGAYQARDTLRTYSYSNNFPFSRGYPAIDFPRMWKWGVNYHLPLFLPDWGVAHIIYFLRVRANVFYDWTTVRSLRQQRNFNFRTAGAEVYFDTKWWNQQELSFGFRYSRLLDAANYTHPPSVNQWELILPVINIHSP